MAGYVPVLLITANVGSIFEEPSVMLNIWTEEFLATIARLDPKFIALHCQEVGGKNYEQSMRHVEYFVRLLMSSEELRLFDKVRVFLDEDFSSAEHFTALGNFYFVHESLKDVLVWDFKESSFVNVLGKEVHSGNIEAVTTKEKSKFPQDFFPECKWSRKGFMRTRWSISGTVFDLINIHLFHDASNFVAMETFPSVYSKTRRRALEHTLDRFHNDQYENVPYFLFGDFNFRTDTAGVIKKLTEDTQESKLPSQKNFSKLQFHNKNDDLILTLGKKEFSHFEHQHVFVNNSGEWLREYDKELKDFEGRLLEFPIHFLPSYPFAEDIKEGSCYMKTRVPAWCDRILLSPTAKIIAKNTPGSGDVEYGIIGQTTCMGDHKPVYLRMVLSSEAGTVDCCLLSNAAQFCFKVPDDYVDRLSMLPDCRSYLSKRVHIDNSANFLHAVPIKHDPYTPDSMDSPSPRALIISGEEGEEVPDVELLLDDGCCCNKEDKEESYFEDNNKRRLSSAQKRFDTAVSPALLKSKLELIVQSKKLGSLIKKKSPSECDINVASDDNETLFYNGVRKNRSNSDVSWQRTHLLTKAWVQGKGNHKTYEYFRSNDKRKSFSSSDSVDIEINDIHNDIVIPRISIINASNFESNESSVNINDDRRSVYSDTRLTTYSDNCTKTISGEASSIEKSDDICARNFDDRVFNNDNDDDDRDHDNKKQFIISSNNDVQNNYQDNNSMEDYSSSIIKNNSSDNEDENLTKNKIKQEEVEERDEIKNRSDNFHDKESFKHDASVIIPKINESQISDVINDNINTYDTTYKAAAAAASSTSSNKLVNENELLGSDNNQRDILKSENTTRSNSTNSNDANITLGLTARRVTEICKNDIANENGKCRRCCCVIS